MKSFDLDSLDTTAASGKGATLHLVHPTSREPLMTPASEESPARAVSITLMGLESEKAEAFQREIQRKRLKRGASKKPITPEQLEAEAINLLAELTLGWDGIGKSGADLECTPANVRMVYKERKWIRDQVDEFVGDLSNFLGN
jgi:hypothetical protein